MPRVSVILPVFNGALTVEKAIRSILNQSLYDIELIILNDGSLDNSDLIIKQFLFDKRVRYYSHPNCGLAQTLNIGVSYSKSNLIARQDQDDISHPKRIQSQVTEFEANPKLILLGTWATVLDEKGEVRSQHRHPSDSEYIKHTLMFENPFVHTSVMFRKNKFLAVNGYAAESGRFYPEDYDLWLRLSKHGVVGNLKFPFVEYYETSSGISRSNVNVYGKQITAAMQANVLPDIPPNYHQIYKELTEHLYVSSSRCGVFSMLNMICFIFNSLKIKPDLSIYCKFRVFMRQSSRVIWKSLKK